MLVLEALLVATVLGALWVAAMLGALLVAAVVVLLMVVLVQILIAVHVVPKNLLHLWVVGVGVGVVHQVVLGVLEVVLPFLPIHDD